MTNNDFRLSPAHHRGTHPASDGCAGTERAQSCREWSSESRRRRTQTPDGAKTSSSWRTKSRCGYFTAETYCMAGIPPSQYNPAHFKQHNAELPQRGTASGLPPDRTPADTTARARLQPAHESRSHHPCLGRVKPSRVFQRLSSGRMKRPVNASQLGIRMLLMLRMHM